MRYLCTTQGTADWLIGKGAVLNSLAEILFRDQHSIDALGECEFVEGPVRVSCSDNAEVIAIWNIDYLSGTGDEMWGFIKLSGEMSLTEDANICLEVLERCLYVINQRLQGLLLDGALIHRPYGNGAHTCLAGKGSVARHLSVGYYEQTLDSNESPVHSIICVGPSIDYDALARAAEKESKRLGALIEIANSLTAPVRRRQIAGPDVLSSLKRSLAPFSSNQDSTAYRDVKVITDSSDISAKDVYRALGFTYNDWLSGESPLSSVQRRILLSKAIEQHPLRITGPAGSGKTLLMQLLALQQILNARQADKPIRVLYIAHNSAMVEKVTQRFRVLSPEMNLEHNSKQGLDITTLAEYGRKTMHLDFTSVINLDAEAAKKFQLEQVTIALQTVASQYQNDFAKSNLFSAVVERPDIAHLVARLITSEISTAIKGHGLENDQKRYVRSERRLSRFHGILTQEERAIVYRVYQLYHKAVFEGFEVLDTDDLALSLLGRLRTPIWELRRRKFGYDFVFVDETQLFNENERRIFPLLSNNAFSHVPIVLALDEAQDVYIQSSAGLATLGIPNIENENLGSVQRSTKAIVDLAFFIIQRSTDLFGPDFPDFTIAASKLQSNNHPLAEQPSIDSMAEDSRSLGKYTLKKLRELRKANFWQIAVICHSDIYWEGLYSELRQSDLPLTVLTERGTKLQPESPLVVLTKPAFVGGQEFDAVVLVGLEQGLTPPRISDNEALSAAVEQQAIREMYLSITRARYRVVILLSHSAAPTALLQEAEKARLVKRKT